MFKFIDFAMEAFIAFVMTITKLPIREAVKKWNEAIDEKAAFLVTRAIMNKVNLRTMATGKKWVVEEVPIDILFVDTYQRVFKLCNILKNKAEFDENKIDVKTVSYRDGKFYLVDGWHTAVLLLLMGEKTMTVKIVNNMSRDDEAKFFARQNKGKVRVSAKDTFFSLLEGHEERETNIFNICKERGYNLSRATNRGKGGHSVSAVTVLCRLYDLDLLNLTFDILHATGFESYKEAFNARFLGSFEILKDYDIKKGDNKFTHLVTVMKACGNPKDFYSECRKVTQGVTIDTISARDDEERAFKTYLYITLADVQRPVKEVK